MTAGQITINEIRSSIGAAPNGANLVNVTATNIDPAVAQALAGATIDAYVHSIISSQASQSNAAITFFSDLLTTYQADLATARQSLNSYLTAHPAPIVGARSDEEQAELARINSDVTQAQTRYDDALSKKQDAELTTEKTKADVGERLRMVDAPALPAAPLGSMKKAITSMATFVILGIMLAAGAVVVGTQLDHSIRTSSDVSRLGLRLLTVVPDMGGKQAKVKTKKPERKAAKEPRSVGEPKERTRSAGPRVARSAPRNAGTPAAARKAPRPATKAAGGSTWPG
jgi:capsular polysaccharide biosynthesis protein